MEMNCSFTQILRNSQKQFISYSSNTHRYTLIMLIITTNIQLIELSDGSTIEQSKGIECFGDFKRIWCALIWSDHRNDEIELFGVSKVTNPVGTCVCWERNMPLHCGVAQTTCPFNPVKSNRYRYSSLVMI